MKETYGEIMDLYRIRTHTEETSQKLDILIRKMDKQIVLLEQVVEILTKIEERKTDANY